MHILITGAAGMLGSKLTMSLVNDNQIRGRKIDRITLADIVPPAIPDGLAGVSQAIAADLSKEGEADRLIGPRPDVIVHLAAVVSGEAEADFDKGYRMNLDGTRALFEAIRREGARAPYCPRLVFSSSVAVFGGPFDDPISDTFLTAPLTSYGTQKAMCELLLSDYSRRGILDGIGIRLPTICVRPGKPNKAVSGFFSSILREPLVGQTAVLPVPDTVSHWFASPRAAIGFLRHAMSIDTTLLGDRRNLSLPGLSATVGEQIEALRRVAGNRAVGLIRHEPDAKIMAIIGEWPRSFNAQRAISMGFAADSSFESIIRSHIEDELDVGSGTDLYPRSAQG
ncbi:MAG: nucleoside-diphosphate-sugar epimerase [Microvirga sp.]|nr:nucleoside-diphosphate-sugar epimerase [Microvirga sp.]